MDIQWYPGHMAKTRRMIRDNLSLIDVVVEMVDARAPLSSHLPDIGVLIRRKPLVVAINKADLAEETVTRLWINEFEAKGFTAVSVDCMNRKGLAQLTRTIVKVSSKPSARCMVLGIPNVGKSFMINQLARRKAAKTGDRPGVTRGKMWLKAGSKLELLDTPGVLWPKFERKDIGVKLALLGSIKQELLNVGELAVVLIKFLNLCYPDIIVQRYNIDADLEPEDALRQIAKRRGFLLSGGILDVERSAKTIFDEFRQGRLGKVSLENPNDTFQWEMILNE